jgi:transcriptional regulator with XRE-family HTH domain
MAGEKGGRGDWASLAPLLRTQRQMAKLSLRALAQMTGVSDSYLSQVERGLHQPSPEVLKAMAEALGVSATALYERMGWIEASDDRAGSDDHAERAGREGVEIAIERDARLSEAKKSALITMYRTLVADA